MCGRYTLYHKMQDIADRYEVPQRGIPLKPNYNVAPGQQMPIIVEQQGKRVLDVMKWGLIPSWAKDPKIGYKLINARDDSIFEKPMWRRSILKRRCLVPADGFYEWKKSSNPQDKSKQPYYIRPKDYELFSFAGIWESWYDPAGQAVHTYSIITTEPNKDMTSIHNRMPVILHPEDEAIWLDENNNQRDHIEPLLRPFEDYSLDIVRVSTNVNVTSNNDHALIYPINSV